MPYSLLGIEVLRQEAAHHGGSEQQRKPVE